MAAIIESEGGGNYGRLKRWGENYWGAIVGAPWRGRRRGWHPWCGHVRGRGGIAWATR
jgi:hypothetical protein